MFDFIQWMNEIGHMILTHVPNILYEFFICVHYHARLITQENCHGRIFQYASAYIIFYKGEKYIYMLKYNSQSMYIYYYLQFALGSQSPIHLPVSTEVWEVDCLLHRRTRSRDPLHPPTRRCCCYYPQLWGELWVKRKKKSFNWKSEWRFLYARMGA